MTCALLEPHLSRSSIEEGKEKADVEDTFRPCGVKELCDTCGRDVMVAAVTVMDEMEMTEEGWRYSSRTARSVQLLYISMMLETS
jgi:hypothetical protein